MRVRGSKQAMSAIMATVAMAAAMTGCGSGSSDAGEDAGASSSGGIARAMETVDEFAANPELVVAPVSSKPDASTSAIVVNCTIPACAPGALEPPMEALGWQLDEISYDLAKGPSDLKRAVTSAVDAKPDVILISSNYPEATVQSEVDRGVDLGIKFIGIGGRVAPNYSACIQCSSSLEAMGALAADIALADAQGKTTIAVAYDKTITPLQSEADGVKAEVKKNGDGSKFLEVEQSVSAPPQQNAARLVSFLQRNPDVEYLIATQQFAAANELRNAGLGSRVKIVGMYPLNATDVEAVESGSILGYSSGEFGSLYWRAADAAVRAVQGEILNPIDPIQSLRVMNKDNAAVELLDPAGYEEKYKKAWLQ